MRLHPGCPRELAYVYLGERFGKWPWELEDQPADRVQYYMAVLGAEAEAHQDHEGLEPGENIIRVE